MLHLIVKKLRQNWFLIGIVLAILVARLFPHVGATGGILHPEITVKYIGVAVIFFNSGLSLRGEDLTGAVLQVRVHLFVQCFTFLAFPLLMQALVLLLDQALEAHLLSGLQVLSCMPPPVSSAVLLTKAVGGNEAAAIFNSAFGSLLGIFVTPATVLMVVGSTAHVPAGKIVTQLAVTVLLPLLLGQLVRSRHRKWLSQASLPLGTLGSAILLFIIYTTFCDTFSHPGISIDGMNLMIVIMLVAVVQLCLLWLVFTVSRFPGLGFSPADTCCLMFCCTHKSLTLGIPILKIIFGGSDELSVLSIPLLVYHPTQILLGSLLAPAVQEWRQTAPRPRYIPESQLHHHYV